MENKKVINGWIYYCSSSDGKMIAYYPNVEQLVFETDEAFERWLEDEKKEMLA